MFDVIPGLKVATPAAAQPVSFALDLAPHCHLIGSDPYDAQAHETFVTQLGKSATAKVEHDTMKCLITRTLEQTFDAFPCDDDEPLLLLRGPVQTADFVFAYTDEAAAAQTLVLNTDVIIDTYRSPNQIYLKYGKTWPTALREKNSIKITYKCGFGAARENVPDEFRQLIAMLVAAWFENREAVSSIPLHELPNPVGYDELIGVCKTWYF